MRLGILDHGLGFRTRAVLAMIRIFSRHRVVDAVKVALYRPDFYRGGAVTHEAMRGPSAWSVADRELMAAYVSKVNQTEFCVLAHSATSSLAYGDGAKVSATLADLDAAPIEEPLRATLHVLGKLTNDNKLEVDDIRRALETGASLQQLRDALAVCFAFNITDRLAEAFNYAVDDREAITAGAKYLLSRGYR